MRVCADPNSMPFSDQEKRGFENRIAAIVSGAMRAELSYVWWPLGRSMVDEQLREGSCDMIMGVPDGYAELLSTVAYYRSPYVFVYRADGGFEVDSLDDPDLSELSIGVQRTGIAPHEALLKRGLSSNVTLQYGDRGYGSSTDPLAFLVRAVEESKVDVGIVWGPIGGYYAERSPVELVVSPVLPDIDPPFLSMSTAMTIAVRPGDEALRDRLNVVIAEEWDKIQSVLEEYNVPLYPLPRPRVRVGGQ